MNNDDIYKVRVNNKYSLDGGRVYLLYATSNKLINFNTGLDRNPDALRHLANNLLKAADFIDEKRSPAFTDFV